MSFLDRAQEEKEDDQEEDVRGCILGSVIQMAMIEHLFTFSM